MAIGIVASTIYFARNSIALTRFIEAWVGLSIQTVALENLLFNEFKGIAAESEAFRR